MRHTITRAAIQAHTIQVYSLLFSLNANFSEFSQPNASEKCPNGTQHSTTPVVFANQERRTKKKNENEEEE